MSAAAVLHRPAGRTAMLLPPLVEPRSRPEPTTDAARDARALALVPSVRSTRTTPVEHAWEHLPAAAPPPPVALPDPGPTAGRIALAAIEALSGVRPLVQLVRWVTPEVHEQLEAAVVRPTWGAPRHRPSVLRTRVCRPSQSVAEVTVVLRDGDRVRAAAVRLVSHRGRWRATVLQIG